MSERAEKVAVVTRGDGIEAIHYGSVAVVNAQGELTHFVGDPDLCVMARSAIKPFQVVPLLRTGAADEFGFSTKQLAIMCGSHNGTDEHREVVMSNLDQAGNKPEHLQCGAHWPLLMQRELDYPLKGEDVDQLRHNCSGKHSGFLALARFLGVDRVDYLNPESKSQLLVREAIAELCDYPIERLKPSIDGCSAPNYAVPLRNLAIGFMRVATKSADDETTRLALARVQEAMTAYPEMVSGKRRIDLDMMRSFPSDLVCKVGAEGLEGMGFGKRQLGIAVKIHDGHNRARGPVCIEVLKQLNIVDDLDNFPLLRPWSQPEVRNARNLQTGFVRPEFELRKV